MEQSIDIIKEVINIGMGDAAYSLSELVAAPVIIRVPELLIIKIEEVSAYIQAERQQFGVVIAQDFKGLIEGKGLLVYSRECSLSLINLLFGGRKDIVSLTNTDVATLQEIGNILLGSCLSTIGNMIEGNLTFSMPQVTTGISERYFNNLARDLERFEQCILVRNEMTIKEYDIQGYIFVLLSFIDLQVIINTLTRTMAIPQE